MDRIPNLTPSSSTSDINGKRSINIELYRVVDLVAPNRLAFGPVRDDKDQGP